MHKLFLCINPDEPQFTVQKSLIKCEILLCIFSQAPAVIDTLLAHIGVFSEGMRFSEDNFKININSYILICQIQ